MGRAVSVRVELDRTKIVPTKEKAVSHVGLAAKHVLMNDYGQGIYPIHLLTGNALVGDSIRLR